MKRQTRYLNTDLQLWATTDLRPLVEALASRGLLSLYAGPWPGGTWSARFETAQAYQEPDANIAALLSAIDALDESARSLWLACTLRQFDIGYDCGDEPAAFTQPLSPATLARIAEAGGALMISLYGAPNVLI